MVRGAPRRPCAPSPRGAGGGSTSYVRVGSRRTRRHTYYRVNVVALCPIFCPRGSVRAAQGGTLTTVSMLALCPIFCPRVPCAFPPAPRTQQSTWHDLRTFRTTPLREICRAHDGRRTAEHARDFHGGNQSRARANSALRHVAHGGEALTAGDSVRLRLVDSRRVTVRYRCRCRYRW